MFLQWLVKGLSMTDAAALVSTAAYTTQLDLEQVVSGLKRSIDGIQIQLTDAIKKTNDSIAIGRERSDEMRKLVDERIQHLDDRLRREIDQRENAVRTIQQDLVRLEETWAAKFDSFDEKLDTVQGGIQKLTGMMEGFTAALQIRDKNDTEAHRRLDERIDSHLQNINLIKNDVMLLTSTQLDHSTNLKTLRSVIHGDPGIKDGSPSLFAMVKALADQVSLGFEKTGVHLGEVVALAHSNNQRISQIEEDRIRDREIWQQRKQTLLSLAKNALVDKRFWAIAGSVAAGLVVGVFPEARETLLNVLTTLLSN